VDKGINAPYKSRLLVILLWAALRFGLRGTTAANLLFALLVGFFTSHYLKGLTPAEIASGDYVPTVQSFLAIAVLVTLVPTIVIADRSRKVLALQESEERFRLLSDNLPDSMVYQIVRETDGRGRFLHVGQGIERLNGLTAEAVERDSSRFHDQILEADRAMVGEAREASEKSMSVFNVNVRMRRADGELRWMNLCSAPRRLPDGRIVWDGIETDITERKRAEEALAESEEKFRTIFTNAPVGIFRSTASRLVFVNPAMARMFGFGSPDEMLASTAKPEAYYVHPEQRRQMIREAVATGKYTEHEVRVRRENGAIFTTWTRVRAVPDDAGGIRFIEGFVEDITARKIAEESHARLATVIEQTTETIVITDLAGTIIYVNPAFEKSTGYTCEEAIGLNPRLLKSGKQEPGFFKQMWEQLKRGEVWRGQFINRRKDGTLYEEQATISPVRDFAGKVMSYVAVKRDVTREVQLEAELRQAQKMEAIGQLAGGVAHDFNNILSSLLMQAELVDLIKNLPEEAREGLQEIRGDIRRASDLTRQLLLFSRRQVMQPRLLDLNGLVTNLGRMLQRLIREDVHLELHLWATPLLTHADASMLEQVLINLAVNARDAMPGGGQLRIETAETVLDEKAAQATPGATPGRYVCLSVSDTGSGMPPEILPRIFEPFFTTKEAGKGTGLGLATVFGIVKQHQGWIVVNNRPGQGVAFTVGLPASPEARVEATETKASPKPRPGTETILLVEDEPGLLKVTRILLERNGYKVLAAANGQKAIECWQEHQAEVALLLTDMVMPGGISGQELAARLRGDRPQLKVIFVSGYSANIAGREFQLGRGEAFIPKPFATDQLLKVIRESLDAVA